MCTNDQRHWPFITKQYPGMIFSCRDTIQITILLCDQRSVHFFWASTRSLQWIFGAQHLEMPFDEEMQTHAALVFTIQCTLSANVDGNVYCSGDVYVCLHVHLYVYTRIKISWYTYTYTCTNNDHVM